MTGRQVSQADVEEYLTAARAGDVIEARSIAMRLIDSGVGLEAVLVDLLCAAQREVGERWHRNEWTVADEHLVSGLTQRVLDAVGASIHIPLTGVRGHLLVTCAEGDWHSLPAQVLGEVLRARGWDVSFLGASTPAAHVATYLERRPATAMAIASSVPLFMMGVRRLCEVAHEHRIPVVVGGRAFGPDATRAGLLGADAWAPDVRDAADILEDWATTPPTRLAQPAPIPDAYLTLEPRAVELARTANLALEQLFPQMTTYDSEQRARTLEDLEFIARFLSAATLVDDARILHDFVEWLAALLEYRGVPRVALTSGIEAVADAVDPFDPSSALLARGSLASV